MSKRAQRLVSLAVLGCLMMLATAGQAAEVVDLYKASVDVANRSTDARNTALAKGLATVLIRVSGNSAITAESSVQDAMANSNRFVVQYGYQTREELSPEDGSMLKQTYLKVSFDEAAVNQFLRRQGFPIWSASRPNVVLWGAVRDEAGRQVIGGKSQPALQQLLQMQAKRRGLPLILPAYDEEDLAQVRTGDIWGMFVEPINTASQRYSANVVVVVKMLTTPDQVQISAAMNLDERQQWWETSGDTLEAAVAVLMDQLGDRIGERFAVQASMEVGEQVILEVAEVDQLTDYANLGEYLDSVLAIRGWHLRMAQGSKHQYLLTLESNLDALQQSFRIDRKLLPQPPQWVVPLGQPQTEERQPAPPEQMDDAAQVTEIGTDTQEPAVLYYRWNG